MIFLGIDLGTSYFKAGLFDEQGNLIGLGRCAVEKSTHNGTQCELSVASFWFTLRECVSQAIQAAGISPNEIVSMSFASQANSFLLLNEDEQPLTPLILWPDERARQVPEKLKLVSERDDFQKKTGLGGLLSVHSMVVKIDWIQENQPDTWSEVRHIMTISDYLTFSLTGKKITDYSTFSLTGLLDLQEEKWWDAALSSLNINENYLNIPQRSGTFVGTLTESGSKQLGLSSDTKYFLGGLDHHMVGVGAGLPGTLNISESTGTVLACVNYQNGYFPQNGVNIAPGLTKDFFFQMTFNENGATALEWYQKNYAPEFSIVELLAFAEKTEPGSDGLLALPSVDAYTSLSGFQNMKEPHSHGHFVRAILESTSLSLLNLISSLDKKGMSETIISSGGGAQSQLWIQIKADILNKTFILPECSELACKGAAMIGMMGISENGIENTSHKQVSFTKTVTPISENVEKYKLIFEL